MNVTEFGPRPCERVRRYLDSYLSNELLVETNHEVLRHLESCRSCTAELEGRARVRQALQSAVRADRAPAALEGRIRGDIRNRAGRRAFGGLQWSLALAASALVILAGWAVFRSLTLRDAAIGQRAAAILDIGVTDHVHCAVAHGLDGRRLSAEQMADALGSDYADLVPSVRARIPAGYEIALAHRCRVGGREFVHLVLEQQGRILSVAITRKNGESFSGERLAASLEASGIPIYQGQVQSYDVAGFETRDHLAFVVSNVGREANSGLAASLAPGVRILLARLEV